MFRKIAVFPTFLSPNITTLAFNSYFFFFLFFQNFSDEGKIPINNSFYNLFSWNYK